ncbi:MAG: adenylate kinase [Candidatus Falkowbacteria bacterium]|nr:adenylate kinase [Candidatus Falkowbacteria bacterium]
MEIFIFFGPPGAGKGTQAKKFALKYGFKHISTGELLRQEIIAGTDLGQTAKQFMADGNLVPDELVIAIIDEQLKEQAKWPGFVFDGFPRTHKQADSLDEIATQNGQTIKKVIYMEADESGLIERLLKREKIEGRLDDTEATIKNRFNIYHQQTEPVLDHYRRQGKFVAIDATGSVEEVEARIEAEYEKVIKD